MSAGLTRGDVVLVSFPFTNLSGSKVRPAVVVNVLGDDVLLAFISSVVPGTPAPTEFVLSATHPDFRKSGLKTGSTFKLGKLLCLHHGIIQRKLGSVSPVIQRELDTRLARAVGLE